MKICVLGSGNVGTAVAADLTNKGFEVTLVKTSKSIHNKSFEEIIKNKGKIIVEDIDNTYNVTVSKVTRDIEESVKSAHLILVFIQTNYHESLIMRIKDYLHDGQVLLFNPGYLSSAYVLKHCKGKDITIVEAESSPIDCRIIEPGKIKVFFKNVRNPIGIYPRAKKEIVFKEINKLGYNFILLDNVVEAALHNPNLIVHTIGAIMSIPRIEYSKGDYWMYREVFTKHVWNIVLSLDEEKMSVLEKVGLHRLSYVEACKIRNSIDSSKDATEVFFDYARNKSPNGPKIPDSRYLTEDVPQGLVLLESLGKHLDIETPTCSGLINISNAAMNEDYRISGRTIESLVEENIKDILSD